MPGMGESCSHVVSLLSTTEAGARFRDSTTVTQKKLLPAPTIKDVPYTLPDFQGKGTMLNVWKAF